MLASTKTLITRATGTAVVLGAAGLVLFGCGTDDTTAPSDTSGSPAATSAPASSTDKSGVAVVPGPNPSKVGSPTSIPADRQVPDVPGTKCGATRGPDGALELVILKGKIRCDTAKKVADEYGPMIASGRKQTVQGWTCGPSASENILAACAKGEDTFVFQLPN
ncbi:hypothetical protein [Gordonia crocea]|uniref:Uncharacterized protein n=1 Tax=Gordonia crocea TaxID=589162 RepID=A0A7I9V0F3_9ACTN|nr:hypothetical protein [Gordonia crocea]GED96480.1 hypothetical protein nbrc107697_05190 [Gordonia crocea]GED98652.1 hypothetical protein nbrc107697_26910 [Gordonia crocea]